MSSYCGNSDCQNRQRLLPEFPISEKFRQYEQLALRVRSFAGLTGIHDRLDPYALAESVGLRVVPLESIAGLSEETKAVLQSPSGGWSGGATPMLPDGTHIVILNPSHSETRKMATLMEEICHVLLGHKHSELSAAPENSEAHRTHNQQIEEEAYAVGAAALLPYRALLCNLSRGQTIKTIAAQSGISQALVRYRIKVLRLSSYLA
ncbi:MAG: ImmA/IrrE family metallo-endopeptidase [Acidobacteriota bacterium]|nr:ImmA/IrrE family metallo-endopeptidase [Acidobacteriota bacterium]